MVTTPFHPGELEAQARAGGGPGGSGLRDFLTGQHRAFFAALPFIGLATKSEGWPVATLLAGEPGFVSTPDEHTIHISAPLEPSDPAAGALVAGAPVGLLGIDLGTRRRNRVNGLLAAADGASLSIAVRETFGNCPQYIHVRDVARAPSTPEKTECLAALDPEARRLIAAADTFFVASSARTGEERGGVDLSHRGGPRGFVELEGDTLTIPDYSGNRYFNTLGNLVDEPRAALLFVDFARGDLLLVQGRTEIVWEGPEVDALLGAERLWRVLVERAFRRRSALGLSWTPRAAAL